MQNKTLESIVQHLIIYSAFVDSIGLIHCKRLRNTIKMVLRRRLQ